MNISIIRVFNKSLGQLVPDLLVQLIWEDVDLIMKSEVFITDHQGEVFVKHQKNGWAKVLIDGKVHSEIETPCVETIFI